MGTDRFRAVYGIERGTLRQNHEVQNWGEKAVTKFSSKYVDDNPRGYLNFSRFDKTPSD